jgi:hypothetical protein
MWFEKITTLFKTKEHLLPLQILFISAFLLCLNPRLVCASSETNLLDPTIILLQQAQTQTAVEEKITSNKNNTIAIPDIELKSGQYPQTLPLSLSPDARFMYFSTIDASSKDVNTGPARPVPEQRQLTQKDKLLRTSVSSITDDSNSRTKQTLNSLIEQIGSMKIRPKAKEIQPESKPAEDNKKDATDDAKETGKSTETETAAETEDQQQISANALNPEIVQKLEWIIEQSATTDDPQLLADMLYQCGYYELATYFYELAISRGIEEQMEDADKSWLMMQKAVCLSNTNPQQALKIYQGLISQYPASPWMDLAKNYEGLIDWLEAQQPKKLIEQCRQDLKVN